MTPAQVTEYLDALRAGRCMSAELVLPTVTIRAVFAPDDPEPAGFGKPLPNEPEPGAWKTAGEVAQ